MKELNLAFLKRVKKICKEHPQEACGGCLHCPLKSQYLGCSIVDANIVMTKMRLDPAEWTAKDMEKILQYEALKGWGLVKEKE